jgi:hypothetical protein
MLLLSLIFSQPTGKIRTVLRVLWLRGHLSDSTVLVGIILIRGNVGKGCEEKLV